MARITRRDFLKGSAAMGAAAALPYIFVRQSHAAWTAGTKVHPNIDDLRVVGLTDAKMTTDTQVGINWAAQEKLVNAEVIAANMDKLACSLAKTKQSKQAWEAIFVKPPQKTWADTVVAIKTNQIALQRTRSPVMAKVCHVLTDVIGVKGENINIFDACHGGGMARNNPFRGLPEGVHLRDTWGGSTVATAVPEPFQAKTAKCVKSLTDGSVDILINIALCKGHGQNFGGFTMTMKNHLGTFSPRPVHSRNGGLDYILGINRTPEILGAMDANSGKVLYPRQQLCLIDALWASNPGPGGHPTHQPNMLIMGVFPPAIDYVVGAQFRAKQMGWRTNIEATERMLTSFGYKKEDLPEGGKIIPA